MGLTRYRAKRDFARTPEPAPTGTSDVAGEVRRFVVQKHDATRLHFDLRLELDGVLLSWAVPKGPSLDPADKRLAIPTEDHPLAYADFEGLIPAGEYGGGPTMIWDEGTWAPQEAPAEGYASGKLKFTLQGHRLRGGWALIRTHPKRPSDKETWLLVKEVDAHVATPGDLLVQTRTTSIRTRRTLEDILAGRDPPVPDAPRGPLPPFVAPALATASGRVPAGTEWRHELKLDGYRALVRVEGGAARILTRTGIDWTDKFAPVARAAAQLPVKAALLDGEVVVLDARGRSDFGALVRALGERRVERLAWFAFDLLHLDGHDVRGLPLSRRSDLLAEVMRDALPPLRLLEHVEGQGPLFLRSACEHGLEGIVSKRTDAPYRSGRGRAWQKGRCGERQEFAIAGWTDPRGSREGLGALIVAYRDADVWRYAGRVGTGFDDALLASLRARLQPDERPTPPVVNPPTVSESLGCHWVEPRLVAEVKFTGWTPSGRLRHPVFLGLREDKCADDVCLEVTMNEVPLSNPGRVFWPDAGVPARAVTKQQLADYLESVAERMLPEIARRPLTLVRCPGGQHAGCFYQRHLTEGLPDGVRGIEVPGHGEGRPFLWVDDSAGLVGLAQIGALEIHPWGARIDHLDKPDRLIFDLDPSADIGWDQVVDVARRVHDRLHGLGLRSFAKVTGGKGIHVVVPLRPHAPWEVAKPFCRLVAEELARADPERITAKMAKAGREHRVYIDWLRNTPTSTAIAAWSPRARPGAAVAVPVAWDMLATVGAADRYTLRELVGGLPLDPWGRLDAVDQRLDADVLGRLRG